VQPYDSALVLRRARRETKQGWLNQQGDLCVRHPYVR